VPIAKVVFWLLDVSYEATEDSAEVRLWGVSNSGERVLVVEENVDVATVGEEIKSEKHSAIVNLEASRMLKEKVWELAVGDKVGFVMVAGPGRLYERVKPFTFASCNEVEIEYYVSKQVAPATARVLESFGVTDEQLLISNTEPRESRRLTDFLGN